MENQTEEQKLAHEQSLENILNPLGFKCIGDCKFEHKSSPWTYDLSATSSDPMALMTHILQQTMNQSCREGEKNMEEQKNEEINYYMSKR